MQMHMLTTTDNPFDPFDDFPSWYQWDEREGYHTTSYLARIAIYSDELSEEDQHLAIERAIDEIVNENLFGVHVKVSREVPETTQNFEEV